jgi:hypothetical protein
MSRGLLRLNEQNSGPIEVGAFPKKESFILRRLMQTSKIKEFLVRSFAKITSKYKNLVKDFSSPLCVNLNG